MIYLEKSLDAKKNLINIKHWITKFWKTRKEKENSHKHTKFDGFEICGIVKKFQKWWWRNVLIYIWNKIK